MKNKRKIAYTQKTIKKINTCRNILVKPDFFSGDIKLNLSRVFPVVVVATMSSGKSTLINALVGMELLPAKNQACTAKRYSILDDDSMNDIRLYIASNNGTIEFKDENIPEELNKANSDDNVTDILITGDIKGILNTDRSLLIIDTPGVNNSRDDRHSDVTQKTLEQVNGGLLIYVLNTEQFAIVDDSKLLKTVKNHIEKNPNQNIIFVLNKVDSLDFEKESLVAFLKNVKEYLVENGFPFPEIIPISAGAALAFKKVLSGIPLSRKERIVFDDCYELFKSSDIRLKYYSITKDSGDLEQCIIPYPGHREITVADLLAAIENTGINFLEQKIQNAQILSSKKDEIKIQIN